MTYQKTRDLADSAWIVPLHIALVGLCIWSFLIMRDHASPELAGSICVFPPVILVPVVMCFWWGVPEFGLACVALGLGYATVGLWDSRKDLLALVTAGGMCASGYFSYEYLDITNKELTAREIREVEDGVLAFATLCLTNSEASITDRELLDLQDELLADVQGFDDLEFQYFERQVIDVLNYLKDLDAHFFNELKSFANGEVMDGSSYRLDIPTSIVSKREALPPNINTTLKKLEFVMASTVESLVQEYPENMQASSGVLFNLKVNYSSKWQMNMDLLEMVLRGPISSDFEPPSFRIDWYQ